MKTRLSALVLGAALAAGAAHADDIVLKDPAGDDNGPGSYVYPTDPVYRAGSFDLSQIAINADAGRVTFDVKLNTALEDAWRTGTGFSVQMIFIFIDTDNVAGSGHTASLPGLNVTFDPANAWDKVVVLTPQTAARVKAETAAKAPELAANIVTVSSKGRGQSIIASAPLAVFGGGDPATWSYQVVAQSNEGFPAGQDFLTRRVSEFAGAQRFGGGTDFNCDPHVIDILAGAARGVPAEAAAQHAMLSYECSEDGEPLRQPVLRMVRP